MDSILPNTLKSSVDMQNMEKTIVYMNSLFVMQKLLLYLVDTASDLALPFLASQFDVSTHFNVASTDAAKREVIKNAIRIKNRMGTVAMIKQAMADTGFSSATLQEHVANGDVATDWANFSVNLPLDGVTPVGINPVNLELLVLEYKQARDYWLGVKYAVAITDTIASPTETVIDQPTADPVIDTLFTGGFKYNGQYKYNGTQKYKPGVEDVQITIV